MFKKLTNASVNLVHKWLPDALLFAIILTIICFLAAMGFTGKARWTWCSIGATASGRCWALPCRWPSWW